MSRINRQDERLVRDVRPLEQQRSFLVQPRRFASAGSGLRGLGQAFEKVAKTVRSAEERVKKERKEKTDTATYNKLVEARNRANTDPATYGDEYIEMYQSTLEGLEESDPLRTRVLGLDADNYVSSRIEAEEQTIRGQITTGLRKTFVEIGNTYDSMTEEERLEYINLPATDRYKRLYNEYLDAVLENDEDVHNSILKYPQLETLLSQEVDRRSQTFQSGHDAALAAKAQIRFQDTVDGIVTEYETGGTWNEDQMQALATRNGIPVEVVRKSVLDRTLMSLRMDLEQGRLTLGDTSEKFLFLQEKAAEYGRDAEAAVTAAQNEFINIAMADVRLDVEGRMEKSIAEDVPLDQVLANANTYLLSVLGDVTDVEYGPDDSILSAETKVGMPNAILAELRKNYKGVQDHVREVQRQRAARENLTIKSGYEQMKDASAIPAIRRGEWSRLQAEYSANTPLEAAFRAGLTDYVIMNGNFQLSPGYAEEVHTLLIEGGPGERAWALGAIGAYRAEEFRHSIRSLPPEQQEGLMAVHNVVMGTRDISSAMETDEFLQSVSAAYDSGSRLLDGVGGVGSNPAPKALPKGLPKKLGYSKKTEFSSDADIHIRLVMSQFDALNLSEDEVLEKTAAAIRKTGSTLFYNSLTGKVDVFDDVSTKKILPQSWGHSEKQLKHEFDFRSTLLGMDVIQAPDFDENRNVVEETFRQFTGNWTPILGSVIAEDLGREVSGPANALLEVATDLFIENYTGLPAGDESLTKFYSNLFTSSKDSDSYLELGIGTEGGKAFLVATGVLNGRPLSGQNAVILTDWQPHWNQAIGKSKEQLERIETIERVTTGTALYFADPNTLGGASAKFLRDAAEASAEAQRVTREVTGQSFTGARP